MGGGAGWSLTGNASTTPGTNYLGTSDNQALEIKVNAVRALRLEPNATSPNLIGGYSGNWLTSGVYGAAIGGGGISSYPNRVTDNYGTVGGGIDNQAGDSAGSTWDEPGATVGGGSSNTASGTYATVGGGVENAASGDSSTVGGGSSNTASSTYATVGGGAANTASGDSSTVGGGFHNTAGYMGTVPGGAYNSAGGDGSFAAGSFAKANFAGCFVWADANISEVACTARDQWVARASGGVTFYTNATMTTGVAVAAGGGSWSSVSDRNLKENVKEVDSQALLASLAQVPVSTWNYKTQDDSIRHIGPMAQDFYAAFGVGENDTHITTVDADGVALAAIQALYAENQALKAENASQQEQIDTLRKQNASLDARLTALEAAAGKPVAAGARLPVPWLLLAGGLVVAGGSWAARRRTGGVR